MKCELVYASEFEEFFYKENDMSVSEGNPVGVYIDIDNRIEFFLFDDIYWDLTREEKQST
jgi:hypothetical protein